MTATNRTAFGVLYYAGPHTKTAEDYTTLAIIGVPTYANKRNSNSVMCFPDRRSLYAVIEDLPSRLL